MQTLSQLGSSAASGANQLGTGIASGAQQLGGGLKNYFMGSELQGPTQGGGGLYGGGVGQQGLFGGAIQQSGALQNIAPYLSDFLRGQGIAGNLLNKGLGTSPEQLSVAGVNMNQGGLLGDVMSQILSKGARRSVVESDAMPMIQPKSGFIQNLISGYTGGLVGGHSGY